jgi:hypothetical protein
MDDQNYSGISEQVLKPLVAGICKVLAGIFNVVVGILKVSDVAAIY